MCADFNIGLHQQSNLILLKLQKDINISFMLLRKIQKLTSLGMGYSSDSSMRTTWLILGLFSESGSTHLKAVKRARLRALVDGLASIFGSTTSSDRLLPTIIFSQSTRFTCKYCNSHHIKRQNLIGPNKNYK